MATKVRHTRTRPAASRRFRKLSLDFYFPEDARQAPVAVIAHGFSRTRRNMAGWGRLLAENGITAIVPDLPSWMDYQHDARAIGELLTQLHAGELFEKPSPTPHTALIGFSMGGLSTLLAAAESDLVHCWIGLDPVDLGDQGVRAGKRLQIPSVVLQAEPGPWNQNGNAREIVAARKSPTLALRVNQATHCDPENPTDWLAEIACGATHPARRAVFERYVVASLRAVLLGDKASRTTIKASAKDPRVRDVLLRKIEHFKRP